MKRVKVGDSFEEDENLCPSCGRELGDSFNMEAIYIDTDCGFVTLKNDCDCGVSLERFYDYDRTEVIAVPKTKKVM